MPVIIRNKKGFTLVELALVIVVIAIIATTVAAGSGIVKQFKLRLVTVELSNYKTMITQFKMQYNALPGDMNNASSYWGGATNGNGDKLINSFNESYHAWQHLNKAGLITKIPYNGALSGSLPSSALSKNSSYFIYNLSSQIYQDPGSLPSSLAIHIVNRAQPTANWIFMLPRVGTTNAYNIDNKIDDGLASRGKLFGSASAAGYFCALKKHNLTPAVRINTDVAIYDLTNNGTCLLTYYIN